MSFFDEFKRRNIARVGVAYAAVAWLLAQMADLALPAFGAPDWVLRYLLIALFIAFPVVLVVAWVFEITPAGIKLDNEVDHSPATVARTSRRLDLIIIGVLAIAVVFLLFDRFLLTESQQDFADEIVATSQSIAVLPFVNRSDDSDHFSDGLSEELLNLLAKNTDLKVAGRTSSFQFKGRSEDLREIGQALNVEHLLEGSVRRSGDRLRITAQLIKVDDGFPLWTETFERKMADLFDVQDDVAAAITIALQLHLTPHANRITDNVEAYALYLEALAMSDFVDGQIGNALALLDQAILLDPGFAKAYELRAGAYWQAAGWTMDTPVAQKHVYENAVDALRLDPDLTVARVYSVTADPVDFSWVNYIDALDNAVAAEPQNIRVLDTMSNSLLMTCYFKESLSYARKIVDVEPLSPLGYSRMAYALSAAGMRNEARAAWTKAVALGSGEAARSITFEFLTESEFEAAMSSAADWQSESYWTGADLQTIIDGLSNLESRKEFVDQWIAELTADPLAAGDPVRAADAGVWYLAFGYVEDAMRLLKDGRANAKTTWFNETVIEFNGLVYPATEFTRHPDFVTEDLIELWDERGAPDICSKDSGEWVCE